MIFVLYFSNKFPEESFIFQFKKVFHRNETLVKAHFDSKLFLIVSILHLCPKFQSAKN